MKRIVRKVVAVALAAFMVVGMLPTDFNLSVAKGAVDETPSRFLDLDSVTLTDGKYEFAEAIMLGSIGAIATSSKKMSVQTSEGVTDEDGVAFAKKLSLGGTGKVTERAVKIVADRKLTVTVWCMSGGADARTLNVSNGTEVVTTLTAAAKAAVVEAQELVLEPGTYYLYSSNKGIDIYDIDIQPYADFDLSIENGEYKENITLGAFTGIATAKKSIKVAVADAKTDENGKELPKKLSLGGTGKVTERAVMFTLDYKADVYVYALSSGDGARTLNVSNGQSVVTTIPAAGKATSAITPTKVTLAPGTYYIFSTGSGIDIYDIVVKRTLNFDLSAENGEYKENIALGDFTGLANDKKSIKIADVAEAKTDEMGRALPKKLSLGGTGTTAQRAVTFTLDWATDINMYALSSGAAGRTLNVSDGTKVVKAFTVAASTEAAIAPLSVKLAPGTYYIYSGGSGIDIYDICIKPDSKPLTPWEEVETPVINSVEVNDEGNFVVNFTANLDKYAGAEYVMISMVDANGFETSSVKAIGKAAPVVMIPYRDGTYTFTATAVRAGEAYKVSEPVVIADYILALKKPVFNMLENRGNGVVYVDWVNTEDATGYKVEIKAGDGAYTEVATTTKGDCTISGLTQGDDITVKVTAFNDAGLTASYEKSIAVGEPSKQWYVATVGSNQVTDITINEANGTSNNYKLDVQDTSTDKKHSSTAADVTNTTGSVIMKGSASGKISDDEEGFQYYFTRIDPNTENFEMTATFKITDVSLTPDNQTGFGIFATDILGVNNFGEGTYVHKYFNSVATLYYSSKQANTSFRHVTGYFSSDASNNDEAERAMSNNKFSTGAGFAVGNTYTFTLKKTNDAFVGIVNGQELSLGDTSILSKQDDGSICIGLVNSRKVSVEITDIKFTTSESTGVTGGDKDDRITPVTNVYSTGTSGSFDYEYIYATNVAGVLTVIDPNGITLPPVHLDADSVARVPVVLKKGENTIKSIFTPDKADNLTSYDDIEKTSSVICKKYGYEGQTIYVANDGKADGAGTYEDPLNLATAVQFAQPGQTIVLKDGVYASGMTIARSVCGTADKMITMRPETKDGVTFTGAGINLVGSYWHIYNINTKDVTNGCGITIAGNYNIVEMCTVQHSSNSGIQISRQGGSPTNAQGRVGLLWPSYNLVKNCESFDNCDAGRNDADGFAAKLTCGEGNKFYGCIAHNNIDDGWDLYAKSISGKIGAVTIENCVAYNNGWLTTDDITASGYKFGEGNGFKLGGGYLEGGHVLKNSIAFNNHAKGITSNSCPDCQIYNCISYGNSAHGGDAYNVGLNSKPSALKKWVVKGLISMTKDDKTKLADLIPFALADENNYFYNGSSSYNTKGEEAVDDWFESVDVTIVPTRNEDGTINMHSLLVMKDTAPANSGARLDVTSDMAVSAMPEITAAVTENTEADPETGDIVYNVEADGKWTLGEDGTLTITCDASILTFKGIKVDGVVVPSDMYTVKEGSTVVTLSSEFLNTLTAGEHEIVFMYTARDVYGTFTVNAPAPDTGDSTPIGVMIAVLGISGLAFAGLAIYDRKKKKLG